MKVTKAEKCAWRARYFYFKWKGSIYMSTCNFYIGIDPETTKPELFFGYMLNREHQGKGRLPLPHFPWRWCMKFHYHPAITFLYQCSSRFWLGMDGR